MFTVQDMAGTVIAACRPHGAVPRLAELGANSARLDWPAPADTSAPTLAIDLEFPGAPVSYLARDLRMREARGGMIVDSTTGGFVMIPVSGAVALGLSVQGLVVGYWISARLLRVYAAHPAATPVPHAGHAGLWDQSMSFSLCIDWALRSHGTQGWAVPHRLRHGHRAAIAVTDHADFDDPQVYEAVIDGDGGMAAQGIVLSKSVFLTRGVGKTSCRATLEEPAWRRKITRWCREGRIELGLHMTRPLPALRAESIADLNSASGLPLSFWIDHGVGIPQAIWSDGGLPGSPHYIWDEALRRDITVYWNRLDLGDDAPDGELNLLSLREADIRPELRRLATPRGLRDPDAWKSAINRCLDPGIARGLRRLGQGTLRRNPAQVHSGLRDLRRGLAHVRDRGTTAFRLSAAERYLSPLYRGLPLGGPDGPRPAFFSSQLIREPAIAWSGANVVRLIEQCGLHIAHTYLGEIKRLPLVRSAAGQARLSKEFASALGVIGDARRRGEVWTPGIGELARSVLLAFETRITRSTDTDRIIGPTAEGERTLLLIGEGEASTTMRHEVLSRGACRFMRLSAADGRDASIRWAGEPPAGGSAEIRVFDAQAQAVVRDNART